MNKKRMTGVSRMVVSALLLASVTAQPAAAAAGDAKSIASDNKSSAATTVQVNLAAPWRPFPHFWEQMFGSGRAVLSLRDSYRRDMRDTRKITDFQYVRFHAIFHDEIGLYSEDKQGNAVYNYSYIDQIYDGLLADGVRPFVELSFMPKQLAAADMPHAFWYKPNTSPPKDYAKWDAMIEEFAKHLIGRYGIEEVSQWYFEVWNEPNLDFWGGKPPQSTYWELYDHTARALKQVDVRLRVGGPATAQAAWVDAFIAHTTQEKVPVDFVSTHVYGDDTAKDVFGTAEKIPQNRMVCRAVKKVHEQIKTSAKPDLPLIWSEFNASFANYPDITDAAYMGPWMAETIQQCDGLVNLMSYWTFSDVFEEQGVVKTPFYGGFGLISAGGVPKPAFNAFKLLHQLGNERMELNNDSVLVTRRADGTVVLAVWNYAPPKGPAAPKTITLKLAHLNAKSATITEIDSQRGDFHHVYEEMGSPQYPTTLQWAALRKAAETPAADTVALKEGTLEIALPPYGLALVELR